jgi:hypothetical protein
MKGKLLLVSVLIAVPLAMLTYFAEVRPRFRRYALAKQFYDNGGNYRLAKERGEAIAAEIMKWEIATSKKIKTFSDCDGASKILNDGNNYGFTWEATVGNGGNWMIGFSAFGYPKACLYSHKVGWLEDR